MKLKSFLMIFFQFILMNNIDISMESALLDKLRIQAEICPGEKIELAYLNAFPSTFNKFRFTFYGEKNTLSELYNKANEHLTLLWKLSNKYPKKVLSIWIGVSTNGFWDADAIAILQHQFATYGAKNTKELAIALLARPTKTRKSIIRFLADVEEFDVYNEYQMILENLNKMNFKSLYNAFLIAKEERMKKSHG